MENHPIPQDVTGFQFKLIGNMTIKQFAYVAFGIVFAVILYYFPLHTPLAALIKVIFIPILGGSGLAIAFIPIEGRPIDVMAGNFIKALFYPNQFVYQKSGRLFSFASMSSPRTPTAAHQAARPTNDRSKRLQAMLGATHVQVQNKLDDREAAFLQALSSPGSIQAPSFNAPNTAPPTAPMPTPQLQTTPPMQQPENPTAEALTKQEEVLTHQLDQAKKEHSQEASTLEKQIQTIHDQKQHLEKELAQLKQQLVGQKTTATPKPTQTTPPTPPAPVKRADLPSVPDTPNVIVGIVKDPRGNVLPNMLVEVKDKDGNPVRAFKTNPLGQFASATPLSPGTYTVELEDPKGRNTFQVIQLVADNRILLPIEIVSHDSREELRKQLFN